MFSNYIPMFLFIMVSFIPVFFVKERSDRVLFSIIIFAYQLYALFLNLHGSFSSFYPDIIKFNQDALSIIANNDWTLKIDAGFYATILAFLYKTFGFSMLLGAQFSVIAFSLTLFFLYQFCKLFEINSFLIKMVIIIFAFTPSYMAYCSVEMREPFELFFLMAGVYYALLAFKNSRIYMLLPCIFFLIVGGLFHQGLLIYNIVIILGFVFIYALKYIPSITQHKKLFFVIFLMLLFIIFIAAKVIFCEYPLPGANLERNLMDGQLLQYIRDYFGRMPHSRTTYIDLSSHYSHGSIFLNFLFSYFLYLFSPMPWMVENTFDVAALLMAWTRAAFLLIAIIGGIKLKLFSKYNYIILLLIYFTLTFCWSVMTTNYGTAIRHNMLTDWILILLSAYVVSQLIYRK